MSNDLNVGKMVESTIRMAVTNVIFESIVMVVFSFIVKVEWNRLAPEFFYFLPINIQHVSYWNVLGLYIVAVFAGIIIKRIFRGLYR